MDNEETSKEQEVLKPEQAKTSQRNERGQLQKGHTANPNGRPPKGYSITEWFKNMLNSRPEVKEAMGNSILKKALEGDTTAQKLVWQYMDGMPKQALEHSGPDGSPIDASISVTVKHV